MKKGQAKLQVRFEILNLLFRNPQESVKIPSARELADKFDLARCTVALELKKLVEEGYLIVYDKNLQTVRLFTYMPLADFPVKEQEKLMEGIWFSTMTEIFSYLESYSS